MEAKVEVMDGGLAGYVDWDASGMLIIAHVINTCYHHCDEIEKTRVS